MPLALGVQNLNHWATREVPVDLFLKYGVALDKSVTSWVLISSSGNQGVGLLDTLRAPFQAERWEIAGRFSLCLREGWRNPRLPLHPQHLLDIIRQDLSETCGLLGQSPWRLDALGWEKAIWEPLVRGKYSQ